MDKREIDGVIYVPQAEIELAFKDRIKKLSGDRLAAEDRVKALQEELDTVTGKLGTLDTMAQQIDELTGKLQQSESRYSLHTTMATHGFTDPDLRDAVEWAYNRALKNVDEKEKVAIDTWLATIKENPDTAPAILKPHLSSQVAEAAPVATSETTVAEVDTPALIPPRTNTAVQPTPVSTTDLLDKGLQDIEFYRANRDAILAEYRKTR